MAKHRHKRETNARTIVRDLVSLVPRPALLAAPVAGLVTASAVGMGVMSQPPVEARDLLADTAVQSNLGRMAERSPVVTRSGVQRGGDDAAATKAAAAKEAKQERRQAARERQRRAARQAARETKQAVSSADTHRWTTAALNVWTAAGPQAEKVGLLDAGEKVLVTGRSQSGRVEIVLDGRSRWVTAGYLDDEKPVEGVGGACTNGTSVPGNLSASIIKVHQAVCAKFPEITSYGTWRSDGEHGQGRAVDVMVSGDRGWQVAEFLRANHAVLGIEYLIYSQKIWSVQRGGEGWRGMSDRGSATANHYDHVHVTVY